MHFPIATDSDGDHYQGNRVIGIRERVRVNRRQRRRLHGWAFHQLEEMVKYKAQRVGLPVFEVDPAYTSQRCSQCGHVSRSNRQSQAVFQCVECGFSAHADHNAAVNVSAAAGLLVNQADAGAA